MEDIIQLDTGENAQKHTLKTKQKAVIIGA